MCLAPTFMNNFQNIEKNNVWETIFTLRFFLKKNDYSIKKSNV